MFEAIREALLSFRAAPLRIWYHPSYRLPLPSLGPRLGIEPRRADLVAWFIEESGARERILEPQPVTQADLERVHDIEYLARITTPHGLAEALGMVEQEAPVEEVLKTYRLACGGTLAAARHALERGAAALNLLGGFHRAGRNQATGLSLVNDIGVAIGALRAEGFQGRIGLLDLDAHPPDPRALTQFEGLWVGTLSATREPAEVARVTENRNNIELCWEELPPGADDPRYLAALDRLLAALPADLVLLFVIAGGDVLAEDRSGGLQLTLRGARHRDRKVHAALDDRAAVWLPGGGFGPLAWRVLAGTALELSGAQTTEIPAEADPLTAHLHRIGVRLDPAELCGGDSTAISDQALAADLHLAPPTPRLLNYYTEEGLGLALRRYGFLHGIERLGYDRPRVVIDSSPPGDRMRLFARAAREARAVEAADSAREEEKNEQEYLLVEVVLEKVEIGGAALLFIHWLTLRHPLAATAPNRRPLLPGQEKPGLGLAREASELLRQMARRLGLQGVAFRPAWYHTAYAARHRMHFIDPRRQARFEALIQAAQGRPLAEVTTAIANGQVLLNGEPYVWEPDIMVDELQPLRLLAEENPADSEPKPHFVFLEPATPAQPAG